MFLIYLILIVFIYVLAFKTHLITQTVKDIMQCFLTGEYQTHAQNNGIGVLLIVFILSGAFLYATYKVAHSLYLYEKIGVKTTGKVISKSINQNKKDDKYATYQFNDQDENIVVRKLSITDVLYKDIQQGDDIEVLYIKGNPNENIIASEKLSILDGIVLSIFLLFIASAPWYLYFCTDSPLWLWLFNNRS
jgi:uncharacterized membrane protein